MKDNSYIFEKDYEINSINININKKLGLFGLLGMLQDVAGEHAVKLGFGYDDLIAKGFFWVLVRQKLRMNTWPKWNDVVKIKSWTIPVFGIYAIREYEIFVNNHKIGDCSTTWMILDSETRRPKRIENTENLFKPKKDSTLEFSAEKINLPNEIELVKTFEVRISDLDINNHVNNIKYTQWILDSIPFDYHKLYMIKEYEINFSGETFLDDKIESYSNIKMLKSNNNHEVFFKGNRKNDSKTVYLARMLTM